MIDFLPTEKEKAQSRQTATALLRGLLYVAIFRMFGVFGVLAVIAGNEIHKKTKSLLIAIPAAIAIYAIATTLLVMAIRV